MVQDRYAVFMVSGTQHSCILLLHRHGVSVSWSKMAVHIPTSISPIQPARAVIEEKDIPSIQRAVGL